MMITKELCVAGRKYTDKNGKERTPWIRIGELHAGQNGKSDYITLSRHINLAGFPAREGDDRVFVSMFDPKQTDEAPPKREQPAMELNDEIPF